MELYLLIIISLILLIKYKLFKEVDIMEILSSFIIEIIFNIVFGGINGPLAVESIR